MTTEYWIHGPHFGQRAVRIGIQQRRHLDNLFQRPNNRAVLRAQLGEPTFRVSFSIAF